MQVLDALNCCQGCCVQICFPGSALGAVGLCVGMRCPVSQPPQNVIGLDTGASSGCQMHFIQPGLQESRKTGRSQASHKQSLQMWGFYQIGRQSQSAYHVQAQCSSFTQRTGTHGSWMGGGSSEGGHCQEAHQWYLETK